MPAAPVLIIAGSTRAIRRSPRIAEWVAGLAREACGLTFEVVDLATLELGLADEPAMASIGPYAQASTVAWSRRVATAAGVVFVTPQYNWGYPAPLKNAIDHLYAEWNGKPSLIITYGGHGGGKCAAQLRQVLTGLKSDQVEAMPELRLSMDRIMADDGAVEPALDFADQADGVTTAVRDLAALIKAVSART